MYINRLREMLFPLLLAWNGLLQVPNGKDSSLVRLNRTTVEPQVKRPSKDKEGQICSRL